MPKIKYCRQDFRSLAPFRKAPPGNSWLAHLMLLAFCIANWKEARLPDDTQYTPTNFRSICKKKPYDIYRYTRISDRCVKKSLMIYRYTWLHADNIHALTSKVQAWITCDTNSVWTQSEITWLARASDISTSPNPEAIRLVAAPAWEYRRWPAARQLISSVSVLSIHRFSCRGITSSFIITLTIPSPVISISKRGFVAWPRVCFLGTSKLQHACRHTHYYGNACLQ